MPSLVRQHPAASPESAIAHFTQRMAFETDCMEFQSDH